MILQSPFHDTVPLLWASDEETQSEQKCVAQKILPLYHRGKKEKMEESSGICIQ